MIPYYDSAPWQGLHDATSYEMLKGFRNHRSRSAAAAGQIPDIHNVRWPHVQEGVY